MENVYQSIETVFEWIVQYGILLIESIGVAVLLITVIHGVVEWVQHKELLRLDLAEGIALALEFKMGGELLRTVIVREWSELLILGCVIVLRAAMTFLIHWEIKLEKQNNEIVKDTTHRDSDK